MKHSVWEKGFFSSWFMGTLDCKFLPTPLGDHLREQEIATQHKEAPSNSIQHPRPRNHLLISWRQPQEWSCALHSNREGKKWGWKVNTRGRRWHSRKYCSNHTWQRHKMPEHFLSHGRVRASTRTLHTPEPTCPCSQLNRIFQHRFRINPLRTQVVVWRKP